MEDFTIAPVFLGHVGQTILPVRTIKSRVENDDRFLCSPDLRGGS